MKKLYSYISASLGIVALLTLTCCSDFLEINPPKTEIVSASLFESDAAATSAIRGIYSLMSANTNFTRGGLEEYTGIASDELINYSTRLDQDQFFQNALTPTNGDLFGIFWQEPYKYINNANSILEGISTSNDLSPATKKQLEGEAKFVRAFCHFYLAALFGDVPCITTTNYQLNTKVERTPFLEVLKQIEKDLLEARVLLAEDFSFSNGERIQPNKPAATALLARIYLYLNKWEEAETMATEVIDNPSYPLLSDLSKVFLANSKEAIWQIKPVVFESNAPQGVIFILTNTPNGTSRRVSMTPQLISAFESNDQRKVKWVGTLTNASGTWSYIYKWKVRYNENVTEYPTILRVAEQYLIRAEARSQLNNIAGAQTDLNKIRTRAGLPNTSANDKSSLLAAIGQERRIEFCGEFGHRWLDLKRMSLVNTTMSSVKPAWQQTDQLFPIPESERLLNPNLSQNEGY